MKVLFLALDINLDRQRGDAIHTRELARFLAARGHLVDLVTAPAKAAIGLDGVCSHTRPAASDWKQLRFCARLALSSGSEVVYERRSSPKIAFAVSRLAGIPFVVEINGSDQEVELQGRRVSTVSRPVRRWARTRMMRRAARVVAVTAPLAAEVQCSYGLQSARLKVVQNGVDTKQFAPLDKRVARLRLNLPSESPLILFVGNLAPWQGIEDLFKALPVALTDAPTLRAIVIGDGSARSALNRLATDLGVQDSVQFTGLVPHETVPLYIGAADVCIATSSREMNERVGRSPLKLYEYMACGRPVIATDVPGVRQVILDSAAGILVSPKDPMALGKAISGLLANPDRARAMGDCGRRYAVDECSWVRTSERVEAVLLEAVRD